MKLRKSMILIAIVALISAFGIESFAMRGGAGGGRMMAQRKMKRDVTGIRFLQRQENQALKLTDAQLERIDKVRVEFFAKKLAIKRKMQKLMKSNAGVDEMIKIRKAMIDLKFEQIEAIRNILTMEQKKAIDAEIVKRRSEMRRRHGMGGNSPHHGAPRGGARRGGGAR